MRDMREAIIAGRFVSFSRERLELEEAGDQLEASSATQIPAT